MARGSIPGRPNAETLLFIINDWFHEWMNKWINTLCIESQLPWKTLKNLVEYYYMWKTTDRYVQQKRVKAVEAESKLKQVYIPN